MSRMSHSWVNSFRDQRTQMHLAPDVRMDSNAAGPDSAQVKYAEPGRWWKHQGCDPQEKYLNSHHLELTGWLTPTIKIQWQGCATSIMGKDWNLETLECGESIFTCLVKWCLSKTAGLSLHFSADLQSFRHQAQQLSRSHFLFQTFSYPADDGMYLRWSANRKMVTAEGVPRDFPSVRRAGSDCINIPFKSGPMMDTQ